VALLNLWLSRVKDDDIELRLKIVDRIIRIEDLRRKADAGKKGKGRKFAKRGT
jgi:hypothetical protein